MLNEDPKRKGRRKKEEGGYSHKNSRLNSERRRNVKHNGKKWMFSIFFLYSSPFIRFLSFSFVSILSLPLSILLSFLFVSILSLPLFMRHREYPLLGV